MSSLPKQLRNDLSRVTLAARTAAEAACTAALENLAVHEKEYRGHMSHDQRQLRNRLRARGRALGDRSDIAKGTQEMTRLIEDAAYEHWHRLLFTRFLTENALLITDEENGSLPVTMADCEELAPELGAKDGFDLACRFASKTLPGVFRSDDPIFDLPIAINDQVALRKLLDSLPKDVFTASDSLGWTYQFWQAQRKEEVNKSGVKIGAAELSPVTQLFTEDYMVDFLLDNTLGAWWAGRCAAVNSEQLTVSSEEEARAAVALPGCEWKYLRFVKDEREGEGGVGVPPAYSSPSPQGEAASQSRSVGVPPASPSTSEAAPTRSVGVSPAFSPSGEAANSPLITDHCSLPTSWTPAAGMFPGWPKFAKALTCLDPCMGSGHFIVAMFERLVALRIAEENEDEKTAIAAVIRDNLFGLELDPRCTQIAVFNLALAAWKRCGYFTLPPMNLACSGLAPNAKRDEWINLGTLAPMAQKSDLLGPMGEPMLLDARLAAGMGQLYDLFQKAPVLGSLINPRAAEGDLLVANFHELQPLLEKALAQESKNDSAHEMAVTAKGLAKAAEILAGQFTLVATNVPYLGRGKQDEILMDYSERVHPESKADLATCFVERCLEFCTEAGATALVTPQIWLFLEVYKALRMKLLDEATWLSVARLGTGAFETISGEVVNAALFLINRERPIRNCSIAAFDVSAFNSVSDKASELLSVIPRFVKQSNQRKNPDARVTLADFVDTPLLGKMTTSTEGLSTGDGDRFIRQFWENKKIKSDWEFFQAAPETIGATEGFSEILFWENGEGILSRYDGARIQGHAAWDRPGVLVGRMSRIRSSLYGQKLYSKACVVLTPRDGRDLAAIYTFCCSNDFEFEIRKLDKKIGVATSVPLKVPFDLAHWQKVADEKYPDGLPKPFSSDPTQWLFNGHPAESDQPLHVAAARLLGYRWPRQTGSSFPDCPALGPDGLESLADDDGIVCLPAINREQPAAARLRDHLATALGNFDEKKLLATAGKKGSKSETLEDWLRNEFFEQHCDLFHKRPFLWQIWDGRKDGFSVLVNYHLLDSANLQKLTYTYLGNWINDQAADAKADKPGAAERLGAAKALEAELIKILAGEAPYDIFVRWKPLAEQAIGWQPDLNDGVRLNIRPFVTAKDLGKKGAGILRSKFTIKWTKDRGTEPHRPAEDFPWFWQEKEPTTDPTPEKTFTGHRWNDVHLTLAFKKGG